VSIVRSHFAAQSLRSSPRFAILLLALFVVAAFQARSFDAARADSTADARTLPSPAYQGLGFTVQLPVGIAVRKSELVDFDTYEFSRSADGTVLLGAYAGNAPDFPQSVPSNANEGIKRINGLRATSYRWTDAAGRFHAVLLIELAPRGIVRFPLYVHYWYHDLTGPDAALSDGIIESTVAAPQ
jgi:hypothetical protein